MEENTHPADTSDSLNYGNGSECNEQHISLTTTERHQLGMESSPAEHVESPDPNINGESDTTTKTLEAEKAVNSHVPGCETESHSCLSFTENDAAREIQSSVKESGPSSTENDALVNKADSVQSSGSNETPVTILTSPAKQQSPAELQKLSLSPVRLQSKPEKEATAESQQIPATNTQSVLQSSSISTDSKHFSVLSHREDSQSEKTFKSFECKMPRNSQTPSQVHKSTRVESQTEIKEETSWDSMTHAHEKTNCLQYSPRSQIYPEKPVSTENQSLTGYLDGVISSIQSLTGNQPETEKDNVQISRAELTLMVQQTLAAQTMCNYLQDLVQENKTLSQQNEVLKEAAVQKRYGRGVGGQRDVTLQSLPAYKQGAEAQVFRFDRYSQPPGSLPPTLDSSHPSGPQPSSQLNPNKGLRSPGQEDAVSLLQEDGDSVNSVSLQLPSQLSLDGDPSLSSNRDKEISAAGNILPLQLSAPGNAAAGASLSVQDPNIPYDILANARYYSVGPQQHQESMIGSAGVSQEQYNRLSEELERVKLFVHKICKEGGLHPNDCNELVNLRDKVAKLQVENNELKTELENRPIIKPVPGPGENDHVRQLYAWCQEENAKLKAQVKQQKILEKKLIDFIAKQGKQTSLKSDLKGSSSETRPDSQPPSSVGPHALPTIPSMVNVLCQTDVDCQECATQTDTKQPEDSAYQLHLARMEVARLQQFSQTQLANMNKQLIQARHNEMEYGKAVEKIHSELNAANADNVHMHQQLADKMRRCEELSSQLTGIYQEFDRLQNHNKKLEGMLRDERKRNTNVEEMIKDERKRYARDEKQLLDQVKLLTSKTKALQEELHALGRLAIAVDMARREGTPLTEDSAEQLAALRRRDGTPSHRVRSGSPRDGMSGVSSAGSSHVQPQVPRPTPGNVSASSNTTRRPFQGSSFPEREHGLQTSSTQGSMAAAYTSLPPEFTERYMQQYPGRPEAQFHGNQPLQRTNMASNASSVASPRSRMGPSKHRQP